MKLVHRIDVKLDTLACYLHTPPFPALTEAQLARVQALTGALATLQAAEYREPQAGRVITFLELQAGRRELAEMIFAKGAKAA